MSDEIDPILLAEAMAAVDLNLPPSNDRERSYWRTHAAQLQEAAAVADEYERLVFERLPALADDA